LFLPIFLVSFRLFFLSSSNFSSLQGARFYYFSDSMSLLLTVLTLFVVFISYIVAPRTSLVSFVLISLLAACFMVFTRANALVIFVFYEISLFPILYIILKWGSYPERSLRAIMLLSYTIVFTLPFIYVLGVLYVHSFSWSLVALKLLPPVYSDVLCSVVFFAFAVKLPIYGLHFWLPMAHVEAPTFGSMILAGILLKLGGVGLFRFMPLFDLTFFRNVYCSYAAVFLVFSTLVCCVQSDFKRLIAFSSVSHMMSLVPIIALYSDSSILVGTYVYLLSQFHDLLM
jgi:NADH:ubiquinone oxidoreductase subunit 4 (subunit M)